MRRVLVLRHGESQWNVEGRWQGWNDIALSVRGEEQARARGQALAADGFTPAHVYTSDLQRARRTAELIASELGVDVTADAGFRERHGGEWQGCTGADIDRRWPGMRAAWRRGELPGPPGGEHDAEVLARFDAALSVALATTDESDAPLLVVTHHGALRLVATRAGADVHMIIPNLGGFLFGHDDGGLRDPDPIDALASEDVRPAIE